MSQDVDVAELVRAYRETGSAGKAGRRLGVRYVVALRLLRAARVKSPAPPSNGKRGRPAAPLDLLELAILRGQNMALHAIARQVRAAPSRIRIELERVGFSFERRRTLANVPGLERLYVSGLTLELIALQYRCSPETARRELLRRGVRIRPRGPSTPRLHSMKSDVGQVESWTSPNARV